MQGGCECCRHGHSTAMLCLAPGCSWGTLQDSPSAVLQYWTGSALQGSPSAVAAVKTPVESASYSCLLFLHPRYERDCVWVFAVWERGWTWWCLPCSVVAQTVLNGYRVTKIPDLQGFRWTKWGHNHCRCTRLPLAAFLLCSLFLCEGHLAAFCLFICRWISPQCWLHVVQE